MRGVLLTAPASGSGKTVVTIGLLEVLLRANKSPVAFKCGPDYIDPMFHRQVLGIASENLDSFFLKPDQVRELAERKAGEEHFAVVEGVMGYFDGLGGTSARTSAWEMAGILGFPVILIVDAKGASLSLIAQIKGFLDYIPRENVPGGKIVGVILNRISAPLYAMVKPLIEQELAVRCLGYVPSCPWLSMESRHLGLVLPEEIEGLRGQIARLADQMQESLDLQAIEELADEYAVSLPDSEKNAAIPIISQNVFRLGVARDAAFCFYYEENLRLLQNLGAELVEFSPLQDAHLPENLSGILLGGGYPELYARELSENASMRAEILTAARCGMPILAECGGYLYLLEELESAQKECYPMVGVFEGSGKKKERLSHFGYVQLSVEEKVSPLLLPGETMPGHEFHYWHCEMDEAQCVMRAKKPTGNRSWPAIRVAGQVFAGFPHLYYPAFPEFARRFARRCMDFRQKGD